MQWMQRDLTLFMDGHIKNNAVHLKLHKLAGLSIVNVSHPPSAQGGYIRSTFLPVMPGSPGPLHLHQRHFQGPDRLHLGPAEVCKEPNNRSLRSSLPDAAPRSQRPGLLAARPHRGLLRAAHAGTPGALGAGSRCPCEDAATHPRAAAGTRPISGRTVTTTPGGRPANPRRAPAVLRQQAPPPTAAEGL